MLYKKFQPASELASYVDCFGTQKKDFAGLSAKGKRFRSEHIFIFRFTDEDKIKDIQVDWQHDWFVSQLS